MRQEALRRLLERPTDANKYDFGHVLVVGGSPGMVGAPLLAAEAALRTGAGLVTIASHANVIDKLEKRVKEIMTLRLSDDLETATAELTRFAAERKVSVIVIGPGQRPDFADLAAMLLSKINIPIIIDAGAIAAFRGRLDLLKRAAAHNRHIILTPHAGEYQKLTGQKPPADREKLRRTVSKFSDGYQVTLVLKGSRTLVARPDGHIYENTTGNPGLATAGTGDVLSGVIAAAIAQKADVEAAVYLHGLAGDLAAEAKTQPGMVASDIIDRIPSALKSATRTPAPD